MARPQSPATGRPSGSADITVSVGSGGVKISAPPAAEVSALQAQVQVLRQRAETKREELSGMSRELVMFGTAVPREVSARYEGVRGQLADIERELTGAETKLAALGVVPSTEAATVQVPPVPTVPDMPDNVAGVAVAVSFIVFIGFPITLAIVRRMWRRNAPEQPSAAAREEADRLRRIEASVDAIAIELERISEGQRFVTKLMSDASAARALAAGQGPAEPIPVPGRADAVPVTRDEPPRTG